jgi:hypothetical protein
LRDGSRGWANRQYLDIFPKKVYIFFSGGVNALRTFQNAVQFIEAELARMVCGRASEAPPRRERSVKIRL